MLSDALLCSFVLFYALLCSFMLFYALVCSFTLSLLLSLSLSLPFTLSQTLSLKLTLKLSHSLFFSLNLSLTLSLSRTLLFFFDGHRMKHQGEVDVSVTKTAGKLLTRATLSRAFKHRRVLLTECLPGLDQEETKRPARGPCLFL